MSIKTLVKIRDTVMVVIFTDQSKPNFKKLSVIKLADHYDAYHP